MKILCLQKDLILEDNQFSDLGIDPHKIRNNRWFSAKSDTIGISDLDIEDSLKIMKHYRLSGSVRTMKDNLYIIRKYQKGILTREYKYYANNTYEKFDEKNFIFGKESLPENTINEVYQLFGFFNNSKNEKLRELQEKYNRFFIHSDRIDNLTRSCKIEENYIAFSTYTNFSNFAIIIDEMRESEAIALFEEILSFKQKFSFEEIKAKLEKFYFIKN